jgi:hypothetical protein
MENQKRETLLDEIKRIRETNKISFIKILEELTNLVKQKGGRVNLSQERYVQVIIEDTYNTFIPYNVICLYVTDDTLYGELRDEVETIEHPIIDLELNEILCLIEEVLFVK